MKAVIEFDFSNEEDYSEYAIFNNCKNYRDSLYDIFAVLRSRYALDSQGRRFVAALYDQLLLVLEARNIKNEFEERGLVSYEFQKLKESLEDDEDL